MPTYTSGFSTFSSSGAGDAAWGTPNKADLLDGVLSTAVGAVGSPSTSRTLTCLGPLSVPPAGEIVTGVTYTIYRDANHATALSYAADLHIFPVVGGVPLALDLAIADKWPTVITGQAYNAGSLSNPTIDAGFGIAIRAGMNDGDLTGVSVAVDYVEVTIETIIPTPLQVEDDEMTTRFIDDVVTFWTQFVNPATDVPTDPTGSPAYRVYEEGTDVPIVTGTMSVQDDANTVGFYKGQFTATAPGFEVGKSYCVRVDATVSAAAQAAFSEKFVIRANPVTATQNATAVWGASITEPLNLHPTTYGPLLVLILNFLRNLFVKNGALVSLFATGQTSSGTKLGTQSTSETDTGFIRTEGTDA